MKLKYYLRGLGIGIILSTLILGIYFYAKVNLTDAQIMSKASELGMVTTGESQSEGLFETTTSEATSSETTTIETTTGESTTAETTTVETTTAETTTEEPTTETPTTQEVMTGTLSITGGMYSEAVAQKLQDMGIISSANDFNEYLVQNGYAEKIQTGEYSVRQDMSFETLAQLIIK